MCSKKQHLSFSLFLQVMFNKALYMALPFRCDKTNYACTMILPYKSHIAIALMCLHKRQSKSKFISNFSEVEFTD